jgi:hypothetical protein
MTLSRETTSLIHLLTSAPANTSLASHHLMMVLALSWSVAMVSIPSLEARKEAAQNMEASRPFCTRTNLMGWLAEGEPAPSQKRCTIGVDGVVGLCGASPLCSF